MTKNLLWKVLLLLIAVDIACAIFKAYNFNSKAVQTQGEIIGEPESRMVGNSIRRFTKWDIKYTFVVNGTRQEGSDSVSWRPRSHSVVVYYLPDQISDSRLEKESTVMYLGVLVFFLVCLGVMFMKDSPDRRTN